MNWSEYTRPQYSVYVWNRNGGLGYWFVLRQCFFCMQFWHDCIDVKSLNKAIIYFWCNINLLLKWKVCHMRFSVYELHITLPCLYVTERHKRNRPWRGSAIWCDARRRQPYRKSSAYKVSVGNPIVTCRKLTFRITLNKRQLQRMKMENMT